MNVRPSSLVRAFGAAYGATGRSTALRAAVLAGTDVGARRIDPAGWSPLSITPEGNLDLGFGVDPQLVDQVTGTASWVGLNLALGPVLRRLPLPRLLRGAVVGGLVYVVDTQVAQRLPDLLAAAEQQASAAEQASVG